MPRLTAVVSYTLRGAIRTSGLNEGQGQQARAQQRKASRGQRQQATRDEVLISHKTPSVVSRQEQAPTALYPLTGTIIIIRIRRINSAISYQTNAFLQRNFKASRRIAAKIKAYVDWRLAVRTHNRMR